MEVVKINGRDYVKANKAAREVGYTADYVGQLCRSGAISAQLVGRSWYVDREELHSHKVDKKRSTRVKAREQIKRDIEKRQRQSLVQEIKPISSTQTYVRAASEARYSVDVSPLVPNIDKMAVNSDFRAHIVNDVVPFGLHNDDDTFNNTDTEVMNEDGSVPIKIIHTHEQKKEKIPLTRSQMIKEARLLEELAEDEDDVEVVPAASKYLVPRRKKSVVIPAVGVVLVGIVVAIMTLTLEVTMRMEGAQMSAGIVNQVTTEYSFNIPLDI